MDTLYCLSGSTHSREAKRLVEASGLEIDVQEIISRGVLAALSREGIKKLPCLVIDDQRYSGLERIKQYLEEAFQ
jgi:hypothetical protein